MKENGFNLQRKEAEDTPHNDIALLANTPTQAKTLLQSFKRAASGIGLHVNANKTEYMRFNQTGDSKGWAFETSGQVHLPGKQCLINRERH